MANTLLTPTVIAREALMHQRNNLVMGASVHREYRHEFVKIGESVTIRKPVRFVVTDGATRSKQDATETSTSITIDKRKHVSWGFSTQSLTSTITEYADRYIKPAMIVLTNQVDVDLAQEGAQKFWISGGTPGTTPATFAALGTQAQYLDDVAVPDDGERAMVLNPAARWAMADALKGIYDSSLPTDLVRKGLLGKLANFQIFGDQNVYRHTTGARVNHPSDTVLVDDAGTISGNTIHLDGFAADTANSFLIGDVISFAGCNAVNPVSKADLGYEQQFVLTANFTPASGEGDVSISPALTTSGAYQTVTAAPANNAVVTMNGSLSTVYPQNLAFHKNALALVMLPLELPDSVTFKARVQDSGMSVRVLKAYDDIEDDENIRLDVFYGVKDIYGELGSRLWG